MNLSMKIKSSLFRLVFPGVLKKRVCRGQRETKGYAKEGRYEYKRFYKGPADAEPCYLCDIKMLHKICKKA